MATPSPLARFRLGPAPSLADAVDPDSLVGLQRGLAWAKQLTDELEWRLPAIQILRKYKAGDQPIKFSTEAWIETYGEEFGIVTDNWCPVVIEAMVEKQIVQGFRFGSDKDDDEAWLDWQRNRMDLDSETVHSDSATTGWGYAMVWRDPTGLSEITHEIPENTIVVTDPANRRRRIAGMKRWQRRDGQWECIVFTPDSWWRFQTTKTGGGWALVPSTLLQPSMGENDLNVVPIVEFVGEPDEYGRGVSDLIPVIPLQDAINKLTSDEMIVSEHAGYPQRVIEEMEEPEDEPSDDETAPARKPEFRGGKNKWIGIESGKVKELKTADLTVFGKSISQKVEHISYKTRTPAYLFPGGLINIAAETITAAKEGHVSKVNRRNKRFGESWEEVMRLNFKIAGRPEKAAAVKAETLWVDPETIATAQLVDALTKLRQSLGLPIRFLLERYGCTPQEIDRIMVMVKEEAELGLVVDGVSGPSGMPPEPGMIE